MAETEPSLYFRPPVPVKEKTAFPEKHALRSIEMA